jgi:hypothetical protein
VSLNQVIQCQEIKRKLDLGWKNGTFNLVKPISFDLKEVQDIQNKQLRF